MLIGAFTLSVLAASHARAQSCGDQGIACMAGCGANMACGAQCFAQKAQCEANQNNGADETPVPTPSYTPPEPSYAPQAPAGAAPPRYGRPEGVAPSVLSKMELKRDNCVGREERGGVDSIVNRCGVQLQVAWCGDDPSDTYACPNGGAINMGPGDSYPSEVRPSTRIDVVACQGAPGEVTPTIRAIGRGYCE